MNSKFLIVIFLGMITVLNGCSSPRVKYGVITPENEDLKGLYKFRLPRSLILLENRLVDPKKPQGDSALVIQSVPTDAASSSSGEPIYTLEAVSDFFSETKLKIDKIENTDLISEIGVEVNDKLKENLEKIGSVIGTALKVALAAAVTDMPANRTVIDVAQYLAANKEWQPLPLNQGWVYKLALSPNVKPAGAILAKDFFNNMAGKTIGVLPVSACYDATLYLYKGADTGPKDPSQWDTVIPFQQKIADSQYVQTVALPSKGKIKMHSSCGVSVVNEGTGVNPIYGTLEAAIKQAEAIKKAIDDSKKK